MKRDHFVSDESPTFFSWLYWRFNMNPNIKLKEQLNMFLGPLLRARVFVEPLWESCWLLMQRFNLCQKEAMPTTAENITFKSYSTISFLPSPSLHYTLHDIFKNITTEIMCSRIYSEPGTSYSTHLSLYLSGFTCGVHSSTTHIVPSFE